MAEVINTNTKSKPYNRYKDKNVRAVYNRTLITHNVTLPITAIGQNLKQTIEETIKSMVEGKCIVEGFVKINSVEIITYSSGEIKGENVIFEAVFYCDVCFPVAGMLLNCVVKNITKAGIRAESADEMISPFVVFIARDHYFANDYFNSVEEGKKITARVIAQRFELNDKYVSVIAELVPPKKDYAPRQTQEPTPTAKPRLNIEFIEEE
jgi:DNA-directed RNA polymerase subunit E'/Rpb7